MAISSTLHVELIEKELITTEIVNKELINIELATIDIIPRKTYIWELEDISVINKQSKQILVYNSTTDAWENKDITELLTYFTIIETPTKINSKKFQTSQVFITGTLEVYLNGIKEKEIIIIDSSNFEFKIDTVTEDVIEIKYLRS